MEGKSEGIPEFFSGKSVFITGGTGFVGKAVIEKLLRGCPGIRTIYVLVRDKKGTSAISRLEKLLNEPIFDVVRAANYTALAKVIPIIGDLTSSGLGIEDKDLKLLQETVSVIVHSAATVRFDENLRTALNINVAGTNHVLEIAKGMKLLQAVVHVSTAFSNCERNIIEEKVYPPSIDPLTALEKFKDMKDEYLQEALPSILGPKPNTYTLTKHLGEDLVRQVYDQHTVPVCIVRPSIVAAAYTEPVPGYVDNFNGTSGLIVGIVTGAIHTILLNDEHKIDIIPLDYITNCILAAAWRLGCSSERTELQVYNLTSFENPFLVPKIFLAGKKAFFEKPFKNLVWYPTLRVTSSYTTFRIMNFFVHVVPAYVLDAIAGMAGKKRMFVRIYKKLSSNFDAVLYFGVRKWTFRSENKTALYNSLSPADRANFSFDVPSINWDVYTTSYIHGLRKYALKDESSAEEGKKVAFKFQMLHILVTSLLLLPMFAALLLLLNAFRT